jgi:hypothetical protein
MFLFQLAENLGMTVATLKATLPTSEMADWMAFYLYRENRKAQSKAKNDMKAEIKKRARRR